MGNPDRPVTDELITTEWGDAVIGRLVLSFATLAEATAYYTANPPEPGQRRYVATPPTEQMWDGSEWVTLVADYGALGWRDPRASWGRMAGLTATVPDPAGSDVLLVTAHLVWTSVVGSGFGPVTYAAVGDRLVSIEGLVRFDGGAFGTQDGTAEWRIMRTTPGPAELAYGLVGVPALSGSGGGTSNIAVIQAYDSPGPGATTYEMQVRKRIPVDNTSALRVRVPLGMAIVDLGPRVQAAGRGPF